MLKENLPVHLLANSLLYLLSLPGSLAFYRAQRDVAGTQQKLLLNLLRRNAETEFGRRYTFSNIRSVTEYQARVPLSTYDDYRPEIQLIAEGRPQILTREPVLLLELTSGSTAPTKYIPYTAALKAEFQRAIAPWIVDLYQADPRLLWGQAYWSVTPVTQRNERTSGGIPIGFEEDSEYFGRLQRPLIQAALAVPPQVRLIDDMETFRYTTLLFLLRSRSLALISVWNPTFLTLLVNRLPGWWPQLAADIAAGNLSALAGLPPDLQAQLVLLNRPDPQRAAEIRAAFQAESDPGVIHTRLWPHLRLISCWTEAQAALYVPELARLFPQARLQGKGLIATEGFISLPLTGRPGAALAIRSHFFEFLDQGEKRRTEPLLAHQLEPEGYYTVIITTGGGLYRYQLHDLVQVVGAWEGCPLLRFVGKEAHISDWFGEKLNEHHVQQALATLLTRQGIHPTFAMVACDEATSRFAYTLFIEGSGFTDELLRRLGAELEAAFQQNYHYRYCRHLGQLDPVRIFYIDGNALDVYLSVCQAFGQRAGNIKPVVLHHRGGWSRFFQGRLLHGDNDIRPVILFDHG